MLELGTQVKLFLFCSLLRTSIVIIMIVDTFDWSLIGQQRFPKILIMNKTGTGQSQPLITSSKLAIIKKGVTYVQS